MAEFELSGKSIVQAMQSPSVRAALREKAEVIAAKARGIAASDGFAMEVEVEEGTRPKGRPYARVTSPDVDQEHGTQFVPKRRVLGRAAETERGGTFEAEWGEQ